MLTHTVGEVEVDLVRESGLLSLLAEHTLLPTSILGTIQCLQANTHVHTYIHAHTNTHKILRLLSLET